MTPAAPEPGQSVRKALAGTWNVWVCPTACGHSAGSSKELLTRASRCLQSHVGQWHGDRLERENQEADGRSLAVTSGLWTTSFSVGGRWGGGGSLVSVPIPGQEARSLVMTISTEVLTEQPGDIPTGV